MVSILRTRVSRIANAAIFFALALVQIIIVSWISISQEKKTEYLDIQWITQRYVLGFYISINPMSDPRFTAILVALTAGLQLLLLAVLVNVVFSNKNMIQIYPEPLYGPAYAPEEAPLVEKTINLVTRVSKEARIKVSRIYVYRKAVPNAFSLDLIPIPFFRKPYLVLNTNVLEILSDREIEAVIAHELAHVKNSDSLIRLILSIPRLFLNLVYLFIYLQIVTGILDALFDTLNLGIAVERIIFLGLVYLILAIVTKITVHFLSSANHQAEYLSDYFAAELVGSDVLINSLIHLGQRSETMQVLSREIEWLSSLSEEKKPSSTFLRKVYQRFPKTQLNEDVAREIAPSLFLEEKFEELVTNYDINLDINARSQLIEAAVPSLLERRAKYFAKVKDEETAEADFAPSVLKEKTIDWRRFDYDASQTLEQEEISSFIATLIAQPDKMVFEHELFQTAEKGSDHPSFRERILTVYRTFHLKEYEELVEQVIKETQNSGKAI
ncbi:MAG: M48 family metalloprotease [Candidatus Heimdallarchaeota archaeon]|nr:MAG: M48 family metalloprotease [Candidatus Heimdallarchaeota archaeon]